MNYRFDQEAQAELDDAFAYYEHEEAGLGWRLLAAVEHACFLLCDHPEAGELVDHLLRRWVVRGFPYIILYSIRGDELYIEAVYHGRQRPRTP